MKRIVWLPLAAAAFALLVSFSTVSSVAASPADQLAARTAAVMSVNPGGVVIAPGVIAWGHGAVVLTLEGAVSPQTIGSCATGQYCAWSGTSYTGTKLAFTTCSSSGTSSSLSLLGGVVRSTANARLSGHVNAVNTGTVIYSMAANSGKPVNGATLTHLVCYT